MGKLEIKETEVEVEEKGKMVKKKVKQFWVLVGKKLYLYSDKKEAILGIREILPKQPDATIAEISYTEEEGKGTFNVEGMSWKEIALGWLPEEEKEERIGVDA